MELPVTGDVFEGRYQLERVLGEGGFARVFRAQDEHRGAVALKILKPEGEQYDSVTKARFEREVQLVARLSDPHTVRLFDYGTSSSGLLYLVFELVPGRDLSEILASSGPLDEGTIVHVLRQILEALREAHAVGLLHRDIKPANIRIYESIGDPWTAKLLDFGIAKETMGGDRAKITQTGGIVGTPRYMSPEQLLFEPLGPPSDIYSLGVTAYEMLMGPDAMHGSRLGDQLMRLGDSSALSVPGTVGALLRETLRGMLARDQKQRFQSADAVLAALGAGPGPPRHSLGDTAPQRPPSTHTLTTEPGVATSFDGRHLKVAGAVLAALLLATAAIIGIVYRGQSQPRDVPPPQRRALPPIVAGAQTAAVATPNVEVEVHGADVADLGAPPREPKGCGREPRFRARKKFENINGHEMVVYVPASYDAHVRYPVLLLFHDAWQTANGFLWDTDFQDVAEEEGLIIVSVRDDAKSDFVFWTDVDEWAAADAIDFADELVCVDHERVFVFGIGAGAAQAVRVACSTPAIRAIATIEYRVDAFPRCARRGPIPTIHFSGRKNRNLPIAGGLGCNDDDVTSLAAHEAVFRKRNECQDGERPYLRQGAHHCRTWTCRGEFVSCELDGGRGPSERRKAREQLDYRECDGDPPESFPMSKTIWRFFSEVAADE